MPTAATATKAHVTIRVHSNAWPDSSAACKLKNRLRPLAQLLMCEAKAAESLETKSGVAGLRAGEKGLAFVNVVMACAP